MLLTTEASQVHHVSGCMLSHVQFFATPWIVACQAPLSTGFSRKHYWSGLPFPLPGDLPSLGMKPMSSASPAWAGGFFATKPPEKPTAACFKLWSEHHCI